jgi:Holliday junction resolvase
MGLQHDDRQDVTTTAYTRGRAFEYRIKEKLEEDGYTVWRTAGSHTPCDLLALKPPGPYWHPRLLFVQAKGGTRSMTRKERAEFRAFALAHGARPLLVERGMKWRWLDEEAA